MILTFIKCIPVAYNTKYKKFSQSTFVKHSKKKIHKTAKDTGWFNRKIHIVKACLKSTGLRDI